MEFLKLINCTEKLYNVSQDMVYGLAVWLPLLDVALSIAVVNMVLLLTIFLVCHPTKLQNIFLQNVHAPWRCRYSTHAARVDF